jgi:hypothetical protein
VLGHSLYEFDFGNAGGLFFLHEPVEQRIEHVLVLAFEDLKHSSKAVLSGIFRDRFAASFGARSGTFLGIPAVGQNLSETHGHTPYAKTPAEARGRPALLG